MAEFKFQFERHQVSKIPREKVIAELEKAAQHFNYKYFRQDDFDSVADISSYKIYREFGSWAKAMDFLSDHLQKQGKNFQITKRLGRYSEEEMFSEIENIWRRLGHRPSRNEWTASNPKISYDAIQRRFGGWKEACLKFIEYKSGETAGVLSKTQSTKERKILGTDKKATQSKSKISVQKTRTIPLNTRVKVLARDNFKCAFCGRSPATHPGVALHIDHIKPFSKGGDNSIENLQTLCSECNYGKSNNEGVLG